MSDQVESYAERISRLQDRVDKLEKERIEQANEALKNLDLIVALRTEIAELREKESGECIWEQDEFHDKWDTSCNNAFQITFGTPAENGMKFCVYCGKKLIVAPSPHLGND